jgi:hypothetical protein
VALELFHTAWVTLISSNIIIIIIVIIVLVIIIINRMIIHRMTTLPYSFLIRRHDNGRSVILQRRAFLLNVVGKCIN